jgi:methionine-gamma-lyase
MKSDGTKEWWKRPLPKCKPSTRVISAGYEPLFSEMSAKTPIYTTSTFLFKSAEDGERFFRLQSHPEERKDGETQGLIYSRFNNPNMEIVEDKMVVLEPGSDDAAVLPSGMSAISTTVLALLEPGDVILYSAPIYGGTGHLFDDVLPRFNIKAKPILSPDINDYRKAIEQHKGSVAMLFVETPTNPTIMHTDVEKIVALAKEYSTDKKKIYVAIDNTFLGPVFQSLFHLGIDLSIYSATKFIGGHSDLIGGFVVGKKATLQKIKAFRSTVGATTDPFCCWLMARSLETIEIRMIKSAQSAQKIAEFLVKHPAVEKVVYPGLLKANDSQYEIYKKQCTGPGGLISFYVKGGKKEAFKVLDTVEICRLAVSLGGTESLISHPRRMTHASVPEDICQKTGLTDSLIRLSVGIEDADDLIADLKQALDSIRN